MMKPINYYSNPIQRVNVWCAEHNWQSAIIVDGLPPTCPECEAQEREAMRTQEAQIQHKNRIKALKNAAGIPLRYFDASLDALNPKTPEQHQPVEGVKAYFAKLKDDPALSLAILGGVGTGKTHLGCALINSYLMNTNCGCFYTTASDLCRRIKASWGKNPQENEYQAMKRFTSPQLLVIDEIGVQLGTESEKQLLFEVINARYNSLKSTVLLSNLGIKDFTALLGERIVDRIREGGGKVLMMAGNSLRN